VQAGHGQQVGQQARGGHVDQDVDLMLAERAYHRDPLAMLICGSHAGLPAFSALRAAIPASGKRARGGGARGQAGKRTVLMKAALLSDQHCLHQHCGHGRSLIGPRL
jgi:hypothetical protein